MRLYSFALVLALQASPLAGSPASACRSGSRKERTTGCRPSAEFQKATELDPKLAVAFVDLGGVLHRKARLCRRHSAAEARHRAQPEYRRRPPPVGIRAVGARVCQRSDSASGEGATPRTRWASLCSKRENCRKLCQCCKKRWLKIRMIPILLYYYGRAAGLLSKQVFDELEARFPDSARAHQMMAQDYAALRDVPSAEREYLEALRLRPQTAGLHLEFGETLRPRAAMGQGCGAISAGN